jgi:hypothetical protein
MKFEGLPQEATPVPPSQVGEKHLNGTGGGAAIADRLVHAVSAENMKKARMDILITSKNPRSFNCRSAAKF